MQVRCSRAGSSARLGSELTDAQVAEYTDLIERRPSTVVVQDVIPPGVAPTFERGTFASRPMALRVFAAWTPNGYVVMPGGLARVAADDSIRALSMQSGAASKDVWALARGPVDTFSLLRPPSARVEIRAFGQRSAEPRDGQSVLARALRGAHRKFDSIAARGSCCGSPATPARRPR